MTAPGMKSLLPSLGAICLLALVVGSAAARNPIRRDFFDVYPVAAGTQLDDLPSNTGHCGICHFDFDGSGPRNPYGLAVEVAINSGNYANNEQAIASIENLDSDGDGFSNLIEITDVANFGNTPTFPGLSAGNVNSAINVDLADLQDYLTPSGGTDNEAPTVTILSPNGGEILSAESTQTLSWTAEDPSGIGLVEIYLSDDDGAHFFPVALGLPETGSFDWFVPNYPGALNRIRVSARDGAGNYGSDESDAPFTITGVAGGTVPTTLRDFELAGTQPFEGAILDDPSEVCITCHGDYNHAVEPWHNWFGSMMGQAMRDPVFLATMVIAEQKAPSSGDLCLRCHTPGGWQEGRSTDTSGGMLLPKDIQGVQCDFCHRQVDPIYQAGISPIEDVPVLDALDAIPFTHANGQFVVDPSPRKRGPYANAPADHEFLESPFHRSAALCGTCHDVSNPVFVQDGDPYTYSPQELDAPHPDGNPRNMFPVERTYSEWTQSEYAASGVYAPQFAGNKPGGIVSTCQDCHMRDVSGRGAAGGPVRSDLPLHDLTGGNYFVPDILETFYPGEIPPAVLVDAKLRAEYMLSLAATLEVEETPIGGEPAVTVRVTNETGHKLPSGYPEGRRIWLNLKAYDGSRALVYESGAYDTETGVLTHDDDLKIYQVKPGISTRLADALGVESGHSFHFVLSDTIYSDNRIPPRGFTNENFEAVQSPPVGYAYADGQYWDETVYLLPNGVEQVDATLYYQSTSKEYIEFLRDENTTNDLGQRVHDAWVAQGRAAPVTMAEASAVLQGTSVPEEAPVYAFSLEQNVPNPFNPRTRIEYTLPRAGKVKLEIFDAVGRVARTLVDEAQAAGQQAVVWDGRGDGGEILPTGVYLYRLESDGLRQTRKMMLLK